MTALKILFWTTLALLIYAQLGYPLIWALLARLRRSRAPRRALADHPLPTVTLIIACHNEQAVIADKLENALALDYPPDRTEIVVASDGSTDRTVQIAREIARRNPRIAVLDLPRSGKVRAQDRAVQRARGEVLAFSDANSLWDGSALRQLVKPFEEADVGYVCGEVRFLSQGGTSQEDLYWRYEMALRREESRLSSVTAGNGAIYATRRESYIQVDPRMGHDLSFPFNMVRRGRRALFAPDARASEKMVPTSAGEFRRKRRMMSHTWPILVRGGMLSLRGFTPLYAVQIYSHRLLRYLAPFLHLTLLTASLALVLAEAGIPYTVALLAQVGFLLLAVVGALSKSRMRALAVPWYYLLVTVSIAAGLWDWLVHGTPAYWEKAEGTR